ncbi:prephenate dehydrogenase/arogenate dehydrogenase family protein [Halococcus salsus]|uniref:prephenate dehydrogenase/arogenate dehydrogenase family protein n=1 Tax=Halococcus salsus TaxID=2162894 RepID=UPI00135AD888|nr:prephenate dehydrogenase/arogenate dehydrogenase family protein [Halococcus salsus]
MNLLVVGAGAMGRWFADVVGSAGIEIAFADTDPDVAAAAADAVGGRTVALDTTERFDGVCLAVPISAVESAVATFAPRADRAMLDVTGTMTTPVEAMRTHAPDHERLSLHPLFAPVNAPGRIAVVGDATGPVTDAVREALERENDPFETTPDEHDHAMTTVQARTHAALLAYALAADDVPDRFHTPVSGPLSELADQMLSGSPGVYAEIQAAFDGTEEIAAAAERIAAADPEEFEGLYREARDSVGER